MANYECPKNPDGPYNLWDLVKLLEQDKTFAQFFFDQLKKAVGNDKDAAEAVKAVKCVNSYLAPTAQELQDLGIPPAQEDRYTRCTDSGSLVLVIAKANV